MKYEPETGALSYYFQMNYKPIFRFNSVTAEISDNSARSFPVLCDISYLIQLPMWLFDTYEEQNIARINLGLNIADSIGSIISDNNFLSSNNEPFTINGIEYIVVYKYIIDATSPNYKDEKIIIPRPENEDFYIQIAKLYPRKSTVVSWVGAHRSLPKEITKENLRFWLGSKNLESKVLDKEDYEIIKNERKHEEEVIIYTHDKDELKPDLDSPVIISVFRPVPEEEKKKVRQMENVFKRPIYEIREQKAWKTIK